jgi:type IV pilus assembly protein PilE
MHMKKGNGFTVIELVVAITIVCLLVAVALASYQDHMTRKARAQARNALADAAQWLRLQHTQTGTYLVKTLPIVQSPDRGEAAYRISLAQLPVRASDPKILFPATSAQTYTLQAVPVNEDVCGTLLLDSAGRTGVVGAGAGVADCWK